MGACTWRQQGAEPGSWLSLDGGLPVSKRWPL